MFADLGHFNKKSIQVINMIIFLSYYINKKPLVNSLSFVLADGILMPSLSSTDTCMCWPGSIFFIKNPSELSTTFYSSVPEPLFWPMFIVATLAAIVASQALISASFSIIKQSIALGCFPRVTMKHTSKKYEGRVYSPEINYFLMIACILITVGFKGGPEIGQAYGKQSSTYLY